MKEFEQYLREAQEVSYSPEDEPMVSAVSAYMLAEASMFIDALMEKGVAGDVITSVVYRVYEVLADVKKEVKADDSLQTPT